MPHPELSKRGVEQVLSPARNSSSSTFFPNPQPALLMVWQFAASAASERRRYCPQHRSGTRQNISGYVCLQTRAYRSSDVLSDAHGDLLRGLQVVENTAAITTTLLGDKLEGKLSPAIPSIVLTCCLSNSQQGYGYLCQEGSPWRLRKCRTFQLSSVCRIKAYFHS
jgi:hypothetical protein